LLRIVKVGMRNMGSPGRDRSAGEMIGHANYVSQMT
jgi:hypothetical protein